MFSRAKPDVLKTQEEPVQLVLLFIPQNQVGGDLLARNKSSLE